MSPIAKQPPMFECPTLQPEDRIIARRRDRAHVSAALNRPFVVLLEQQCSDKTHDDIFVGEDANDVGVKALRAALAMGGASGLLNSIRGWAVKPIISRSRSASEPFSEACEGSSSHRSSMDSQFGGWSSTTNPSSDSRYRRKPLARDGAMRASSLAACSAELHH
jgi:hypothetical protein